MITHLVLTRLSPRAPSLLIELRLHLPLHPVVAHPYLLFLHPGVIRPPPLFPHRLAVAHLHHLLPLHLDIGLPVPPPHPDIASHPILTAAPRRSIDLPHRRLLLYVDIGQPQHQEKKNISTTSKFKPNRLGYIVVYPKKIVRI